MPAHEVWLPPLDTAPTLDRLVLGSVLTERVAPLSALRAPIGIVDRPFDQRRDLLLHAARHVVLLLLEIA